MPELRDTDLMGPTQLGWLEEADRLWTNRHEKPDIDAWRWVAIAKECLYLLKQRDDEVAALLEACKATTSRLSEISDPADSKTAGIIISVELLVSYFEWESHAP